MKKKAQNGKRVGKRVSVEGKENEIAAPNNWDATATQPDETMINHLQTTLSLIEGRKVSRREILVLYEKMRQRSIGKEKKLPYLSSDVKQKSG